MTDAPIESEEYLLSSPAHTCNHRVYDVLLVALTSLVVALVTVTALVVNSQPVMTSMALGGSILAFSFAAGMTALSYIRKQDD
ncbi:MULTISPECIES: hypothetical protein [Streptomyces]|uniref:Uncharacterized protein n=1 Tax=Streptomyces lienomycini TaxID=284035 RepID=A0ABV9WXX8_9ACTN|nr:hypothetical protein [Streptomyces lienomycini]